MVFPYLTRYVVRQYVEEWLSGSITVIAELPEANHTTYHNFDHHASIRTRKSTSSEGIHKLGDDRPKRE